MRFALWEYVINCLVFDTPFFMYDVILCEIGPFWVSNDVILGQNDIIGRNFRVVVKFLLSKTFQNIIITTFRVESFTMKDVNGGQCPEISIFDHFFQISKILWNFHFLRPRVPHPGGHMSPGFFCSMLLISLISLPAIFFLTSMRHFWDTQLQRKCAPWDEIPPVKS